MKIELRRFRIKDYLRFLMMTLNKEYSGEFSQSFFGYIFGKLKKIFTRQKDYVTAVLVNGKFAGSVGLYDINSKTPEVGYFILKEFRGKGIASKATKKMMNFGFNKLKLKRVTATTDFDNKISQKILKKLGFKKIKENKKEKEFIWEKRR